MFGFFESKYEKTFQELCRFHGLCDHKIKFSRGRGQYSGYVRFVQNGCQWDVEEIGVEAGGYKLACIILAHELGHVVQFFRYGRRKKTQHWAINDRREKEIPLTEFQTNFLLRDEASAWRHGKDILVNIGVFDSLKNRFYSDSDKSLASYCAQFACPDAKHIICNCFYLGKEVKS